MNFYRITSCDHVNDLSGKGAFKYGGRWNSKGTRILYTAENMALSMLEALAHITMVNQKRDYCRIVLDMVAEKPYSTWMDELMTDQLPADWRNSPGPDLLKSFGDAFIAEGKMLALKVPSVLAPDSYNYLLNPHHEMFSLIKIVKSEQVKFDQRMIRK
jgi:RES domain-containing protein